MEKRIVTSKLYFLSLLFRLYLLLSLHSISSFASLSSLSTPPTSSTLCLVGVYYLKIWNPFLLLYYYHTEWEAKDIKTTDEEEYIVFINKEGEQLHGQFTFLLPSSFVPEYESRNSMCHCFLYERLYRDIIVVPKGTLGLHLWRS